VVSTVDFGPVLARVERTITNDVVLHLIRDHTKVELHDGDEFVTVTLGADPWKDDSDG
jgi:hypothetical protein